MTYSAVSTHARTRILISAAPSISSVSTAKRSMGTRLPPCGESCGSTPDQTLSERPLQPHGRSLLVRPHYSAERSFHGKSRCAKTLLE